MFLLGLRWMRCNLGSLVIPLLGLRSASEDRRRILRLDLTVFWTSPTASAFWDDVWRVCTCAREISRVEPARLPPPRDSFPAYSVTD